MEDRTAILIDGGFYRKRAHGLFGKKTAAERADEVERYCHLHIKDGKRTLYRVFYYDCQPSDGFIYHPLLQKSMNLKDSDTYKWTKAFFRELIEKRKFALRLGHLSEVGNTYGLHADALKKLCGKSITVDDLKETDFAIEMKQKGVDMKIGLDIAHLAYKGLVTQIILVSGDSDFVPAAKLARREGIDFILDPMKSHISDRLLEHVDGIYSHWNDARMDSAGKGNGKT